MSRKAIISVDGTVVNVIKLNDGVDYDPGPGLSVAEIPETDAHLVQKGARLVGGIVTPRPPDIEPPDPKADLKAAITSAADFASLKAALLENL